MLDVKLWNDRFHTLHCTLSSSDESLYLMIFTRNISEKKQYGIILPYLQSGNMSTVMEYLCCLINKMV